MKRVQARETSKAVLLILGIGTLSCTFFYLAGFRLWALLSLAFIPLCFGCWATSLLLTGSRNRELYANLTAHEREVLTEIIRAYARRIVLWTLPVLLLMPLGVVFATFAQPRNPEGMFEYLVEHQGQLAVVGLMVLGGAALLCLPTIIKRRRVVMAFLAQTEYAKRQE
jgi:hypothetical protein